MACRAVGSIRGFLREGKFLTELELVAQVSKWKRVGGGCFWTERTGIGARSRTSFGWGRGWGCWEKPSGFGLNIGGVRFGLVIID